MKLTILGCWAPYPRAGGACSGYLIQDQANVLIDCGNGVLSNLQKYTDFRALDAAVITHFHPDHYMDLFCLRHAIEGAIRDGSREKPLKLYAPETPEPVFTQLNQYSGAFELVALKSGQTVQINNLQCRFLKTEHPLEAYAVRVEGDGIFGFTADTRPFSGLAPFLLDCDLLLCEASVLEKDKEYAVTGHLTARQAATLGKEARSKQTLLTHFWPEYNLDDIYNEAVRILPGIKMANEGKTYTVK